MSPTGRLFTAGRGFADDGFQTILTLNLVASYQAESGGVRNGTPEFAHTRGKTDAKKRLVEQA